MIIYFSSMIKLYPYKMKILFLGGTGFFGKSFYHIFQNFILPKNKNANLVIASRNPESILDYVNHKYLGNSITLSDMIYLHVMYFRRVT